VVLGRDGDGDSDDSGGGRGGGGVVLDAVMNAEEERDGSVPEHGGEGWANVGDGVDPMPTTAWRRPGWRRCRRGRGKCWFKDMAARGFIGGLQ
jgi:hypothetical protein